MTPQIVPHVKSPDLALQRQTGGKSGDGGNRTRATFPPSDGPNSALERRTPLRRTNPLRSSAKPKRPTPISPATPAQRAAIDGRACIVCAQGPCHPAHLVDRSLGGCDDALCVVPLCPPCHRAYDDGLLDLLPYLEPRYRDELAHAVQHIGLARAYNRITNDRWAAA